MTLEKVGLWTATLDGTPIGEVPALAREVESLGFISLWYSEAYGREALLQAAVLLGATRTLQVGSGIASIYGRDALAATAAGRTLEALHPGRFTLGLGVSHAPLVENLRGHTYGRPLAAMRGYLDAIDNAPAAVPGEAQLPQIVIAALGPKMLELAGTRTQGAHPYLTLPAHTAEARQILGPEARLCVEHAAVIDPDADAAEWERRAGDHLTIYTGLPNYRNSFLRQGFTEDDLGRGGSLALKQALVTHGIDATLARIQEHLDAGATEVLVQVLGAEPLSPPREDWARLAAALR